MGMECSGERERNELLEDLYLGNESRGKRLIGLYKENNLIIRNAIFFNHPRRRCTWKFPEDVKQSHIDYIMARQKYRK